MKEIITAVQADLQSWYRATVVDIDTISINRVNSSTFAKHTPSTGNIKYRSVIDLTGYTARLRIFLKAGQEPVDTLTTEDGRLSIDLVTQELIVLFSKVDSAGYTWKQALYDLDAIAPNGDAYTMASGPITVDNS